MSPLSRQQNPLLKSSGILVVMHPSSNQFMVVSISQTIAIVVRLPFKKLCCLWVRRLFLVRGSGIRRLLNIAQLIRQPMSEGTIASGHVLCSTLIFRIYLW